jgi:hypothetical protein
MINILGNTAPESLMGLADARDNWATAELS